MRLCPISKVVIQDFDWLCLHLYIVRTLYHTDDQVVIELVVEKPCYIDRAITMICLN